MGIAIGGGRNRVADDGGFVIFDIGQAATRVLPVPDGFATAQLVAVYPTTRKLLGRGVKTGNTGSQYLIYDLITGDLQMPPNSDGVAFVGAAPAQTPAGPGIPQAVLNLQRANTNANTVDAVTYSNDRKQNGVMTLRIP